MTITPTLTSRPSARSSGPSATRPRRPSPDWVWPISPGCTCARSVRWASWDSSDTCCSAAATCWLWAPRSFAGYVLPSLADTDPAYVGAVLTGRRLGGQAPRLRVRAGAPLHLADADVDLVVLVNRAGDVRPCCGTHATR
jgi:hypothetical protein